MNIELEKEIAYVLKQIGVRQDLSGYRYIKHALGLIVEDENILDHITKKLYPTLAEEFSTRPTCIEKGIRHAIETTFNSMSEDMCEYIFGNTAFPGKIRPTNAHFLAALAETVRFIHVPTTHADISTVKPEESAIERMFLKWKGEEDNHAR